MILKQLLLLWLIATAVGTCFAQENTFSKRWNIDVGYGARFNSRNNYFSTSKGLAAFIEPQYLLLNNQTLGIKAEYSFLTNPSGSRNNRSTSLFNAAYYLTGNLFFTKRNSSPFRPFIGYGLGMNFLTDWNSLNTGSNEKIGTDSKLGIMLRAGFYYRFINLCFEYKNIQPTNYNSGNYYNSYFSMNVAVSIHSRKNIQIGNKAMPAQVKRLNYFMPIDTARENNYATVYIIRPQTIIASLLQYKIIINDTVEQIIKNNSCLEIKIGKDTTVSLQAAYGNSINTPLVIHAIKGKKYYVVVKNKIGVVTYYPKLVLLDAYEGQVARNKLLSKY